LIFSAFCLPSPLTASNSFMPALEIFSRLPISASSLWDITGPTSGTSDKPIQHPVSDITAS
jgi:hypothetical protein